MPDVAADVFLSYAREDRSRVEEIRTCLANAGFSVWMDTQSLLGGQAWKAEILRAISDAKVFVACLSEISVKKEGMVQMELVLALERQQMMPEGRQFIIPVRLDDIELPRKLAAFHCVDGFAPDGLPGVLRSVAAAASLATPRSSGPGVTNARLQEKWQGRPGYDVDIGYPIFHGLDSAAGTDELNAYFRGHVVKRLIEERRVRREQDSEILLSDIPWNEVTGRYRAAFPAPGAVSVLMHYHLYWAGAAHPNYDTETFLFTLRPAILHGLSELFDHPDKAAERLSQLCRGDLNAQLISEGEIAEPDDWIADGTKPDLRNFERFFVTETALEIHFGPEQVGPYAWGPRRASIPLARLADVLAPDGPLGFAAKKAT